MRSRKKTESVELTSHHSDFIMYRGARPHEATELPADWAVAPPLDKRVEDDLIAT